MIGRSIAAQDATPDISPGIITREPNVEAEAHFDRSEVTAGERLTFTITFRWVDDGTRYRITPPHIDPAKLQVVNVATATQTIEDDGVRYKVRTYDYDLAAHEAGTGMVEALTINYSVEGEVSPRFITLPAMSMTIMAERVPLLRQRTILFMAGAVVLLILGFLIVHMLRKRRAGSEQRNPREELAHSLKEVQAIFDKGEYNTVVERLEKLAQLYLFEILGIAGMPSLPAETLGADDAFRQISEKHRATLTKIFKRAEEARYSGITFERHEVRGLLDDFKAVCEH
ncbi:MAG: hypothetical protein JW938_01715 [Candidatus Omnitrophica bacterium]|nr:hypothetical protein [Candidatus Omnitrophota bacterium]